MIDFAAGLERLWTRILFVIGRGRITFVDDSGVVQVVQVQIGALETRDKTPRLAEYGFHSVPPAGADCILAFIAGDRSNGVVIATGDKASRPRGWAAGDSGIYDNRGQSIRLTADGIIISSPIAVRVQAPKVVNHATAELAFDADGNGTIITSNTRVDYVTGSTNSAHVLNPPEIPS